jgi:hypothetical protein
MMIMFGSFLPSLLVGFSTTNFTRAGEPTLSWNQLHSLSAGEADFQGKMGEETAQACVMASLEKSRNSLQTGGWRKASFHASL